MSFTPLLVNFMLLLVSLGVPINFALLPVSFTPLLVSFTLLLVNLVP
ncbi:hypothetical protein P4576_12530 [Peribacillus frigoritolerans]|nr:hypothetical protein [Peribacillus frigoritolerans]